MYDQAMDNSDQSLAVDRAEERTPVIQPDIRVGFILAPQFTLLAFAGFVETLRHAADEVDRSRQYYCRWTVLGAPGSRATASCGIEVAAWEEYGDPTRFDYVVVVGGLTTAFSQIDPRVLEFLHDAHDKKVALVGLCTGSFALAEAGLLDGRHCAIHWRHIQEFSERYPDARARADDEYVLEDNIYTCPGGMASARLALALIERRCGRARALKSMLHMSIAPVHTDNSYVPHGFEELASCGDWRVERAIAFMRARLGSPCDIEEVAIEIGASVRQLNRAFARHARRPPACFWRHLRLEHARWRLANSSRSITQIAYECGFSDTAHFGRWFKKAYSESPKRYRAACQRLAGV